jgi:hypothetical protein
MLMEKGPNVFFYIKSLPLQYPTLSKLMDVYHRKKCQQEIYGIIYEGIIISKIK